MHLPLVSRAFLFSTPSKLVSNHVVILSTFALGAIFSIMPKQSCLLELHNRQRAAWTERDGWLLPGHFGDPSAEYEAVRGAVGLLDLSHRGLLQATGVDRLSFLQGMLSNDLQALRPFEGHYATILNQQGKVLADLRVLCAVNSFYLDFWDTLTEKVLAHLNRYLVADEVEILDRSDEYAILSLQGPRAEEMLAEFCGSAKLPEQIAHHAMINCSDAAICVVRASHTGETGFDLIVLKAASISVAQDLTEIGQRFGARWVGEETMNVLRVEAGVPLYGADITEENLLLETDLDSHVSFTKGCYLGQEIVERVRSRGHVNRRLRGLLINSTTRARPGDAIRADDKPVGAITSSVLSPRLGRAIALGYIHRDYCEPGTQVTVSSLSGLTTALVTNPPFVQTGP
jgi:aminomethyltransferase